jgi:excisionase family DNA binding protein
MASDDKLNPIPHTSLKLLDRAKTINPSDEQREEIREVFGQLFLEDGRAGGIQIQMQAKGKYVPLPSLLVDMLQYVIAQILASRPIHMVPLNLEITTQEAADMLGVSRPFLIKLLKEGEIAFRTVGRHRRIVVKDLMDYADKHARRQQETLEELVKISQETGGYS